MNWKQLVLGTATVTLLAACASTKPADTTAGTQQPTTPQTTAPVDTGSGNQNQVSVDPLNDPNSPLAKRSVYFGFDSSSVDASGKPVVETHSAYLKQNADKKVIIQGNTDARGSREYNLALGQRRAESVKKAMEVLGAKESQLEAVSFGKEKPRATGNTDADFAENRRADIVYQGH
ncbi:MULTISPECIES: peptidoglycan-associated lipoprotein Pal [Chromobacterium]|uniref:peptidoglycan-associated lipoprotein Pal n=1 Tax=Chromobacterium TaxID=535 RepID=UPI000D2FB8F8|nr:MULTISPECIES: peptidoglycan-associated lipoprotein Pal [Chromobacterium]MCP1292512.1 peptidoglycan-associated lipoprotein Pal [Chromobacterium sp. S0633]PTU67558.1 peptidoglycan-associated lipoprotein Pal [Chromobacterium sp. Panama]UJB32633.1 peptidoglycan-associated lipoprotein Pal [Chromobacterium sp. Beijing]